MQNEKDVKAEVKKILDRVGAWYFMPVQTGYGVQGVPDFICCVAGRFVAIETKFGKNTTSAWQDRQIEGIRQAKGLAWVVSEANVGELESYLQGADAGGEYGL